MNPLDLNEYLQSRSYLIGNNFTYADLTLFNLIDDKRSQYNELRHVTRWLNHVATIWRPIKASLNSGQYLVYNEFIYDMNS